MAANPFGPRGSSSRSLASQYSRLGSAQSLLFECDSVDYKIHKVDFYEEVVQSFLLNMPRGKKALNNTFVYRNIILQKMYIIRGRSKST